MYELNQQEVLECVTAYDRNQGIRSKWDLQNVLAALNVAYDEEVQTCVDSVGYTDGPMGYNAFLNLMRIVKHRVVTRPLPADSDRLQAFVSMGGNLDRTGCLSTDLLQKTFQDFGVAVDLARVRRGTAPSDNPTPGSITYRAFSTLVDPLTGGGGGDTSLYGRVVARPGSSGRWGLIKARIRQRLVAQRATKSFISDVNGMVNDRKEKQQLLRSKRPLQERLDGIRAPPSKQPNRPSNTANNNPNGNGNGIGTSGSGKGGETRDGGAGGGKEGSGGTNRRRRYRPPPPPSLLELAEAARAFAKDPEATGKIADDYLNQFQSLRTTRHAHVAHGMGDRERGRERIASRSFRVMPDRRRHAEDDETSGDEDEEEDYSEDGNEEGSEGSEESSEDDPSSSSGRRRESNEERQTPSPRRSSQASRSRSFVSRPQTASHHQHQAAQPHSTASKKGSTVGKSYEYDDDWEKEEEEEDDRPGSTKEFGKDTSGEEDRGRGGGDSSPSLQPKSSSSVKRRDKRAASNGGTASPATSSANLSQSSPPGKDSLMLSRESDSPSTATARSSRIGKGKASETDEEDSSAHDRHGGPGAGGAKDPKQAAQRQLQYWTQNRLWSPVPFDHFPALEGPQVVVQPRIENAKPTRPTTIGYAPFGQNNKTSRRATSPAPEWKRKLASARKERREGLQGLAQKYHISPKQASRRPRMGAIGRPPTTIAPRRPETSHSSPGHRSPQPTGTLVAMPKIAEASSSGTNKEKSKSYEFETSAAASSDTESYEESEVEA